MEYCLYKETIAWSLEVSQQIAKLVDPVVLVYSAFPLIQNLFKKPYKISPLKLLRSFVRLSSHVDSLPNKTLSTLNALEDYLLVFLDKVFGRGNRLLHSEMIHNIGKGLS